MDWTQGLTLVYSRADDDIDVGIWEFLRPLMGVVQR